jgi:hypothetical protein
MAYIKTGGLSLALALAAGGALPAAAKPKAEAAAIPAVPAIRYLPAENRHVRISVDQVVPAGSPGFLPKDKNWLQLRVTITNKSASTIAFSELRERQMSGVVLQAATSSVDLSKPPSMTGTVGRNMGMAGAGAAAGMMLAPPIALAAGVANMFRGTLGMDKKQKRNRLIDQTILRATPLAPGTAASGWAYVPAIQDQTGLIAFYSVDGRLDSLAVHREGFAPPPVVAPPEPAVERAAPIRRKAAPRRKR